MNLFQRTTQTTTTPPVQLTSERDRVSAELEYAQAGLPELKTLVRMGRPGRQEDLDAQIQLIADLQAKLEALAVEEAAIDSIRNLCTTELPAAEAALAIDVQKLVNSLLPLRDQARSIQEQRTAITDRFADLKSRQLRGQVRVPMANKSLLPLTADRTLETVTDAIAVFLKSARDAGFVVPEAEPAKRAPSRQPRPEQPAPMSAQERRVRKATGSLK